MSSDCSDLKIRLQTIVAELKGMEDTLMDAVITDDSQAEYEGHGDRNRGDSLAQSACFVEATTLLLETAIKRI